MKISLQPGSVSYHMLDAQSFRSGWGPCVNLARDLFANLSLPVIQGQMEKCRSLNQKFSEYQLTPLHIATIQDREDAMDLLLEKGANINAQDIHGFTPLHHTAAKGDTKGMEWLLSRGADPKIRTNDGGLATHFLKYTSPFQNATEWQLQRENIHHHHEIDATCMEKGVQVVDRIVATPQVLVDLFWSFRKFIQREPATSDRLDSYLLGNYRNFVKHPPKLSIKSTTSIEGASSKFCGLFAVDPIQKGEIIGIYGGEIYTALNGEDTYGGHSDEEYLFSGSMPIDAKTFRSLAAMANDGFPNASIIPLGRRNQKGIDGLPYVHCMVALENIQPGEEIFINYGPNHAIKNGGHIEPRKEKLREYFQSNSIDRLLSTMRLYTQANDVEEELAGTNAVEKIGYLYTTPGTLASLQQEGLLDETKFELLSSAMIDQLRKRVSSKSQDKTEL